MTGIKGYYNGWYLSWLQLTPRLLLTTTTVCHACSGIHSNNGLCDKDGACYEKLTQGGWTSLRHV